MVAPARSPNAPALPVFYPAMTVNFTVRFDEALLVDGAQLPPPQTANDLAGQAGLSSLTKLGVSGQAQLTAGLATNQVTATVKKLAPLVTSTGDQNLTQLLNIVPTQATVELPGYRQAGHFTITLAWKDFPIDPRAIRALGVEIYVGTIDPASFAAGMVQQSQGFSAANVGPPRPSMLPTRDASGSPLEAGLLLVGVVDEIQTTFNAESATLVLEGRDLRGILLNSPIDVKAVAVVDLTLPIDKLVQAILNTHPRQEIGATGKPYFYVEPSDPAEWPNGQVPAAAVTGDLTRVRLGTSGTNPMATPQSAPQQTSFWDIITNYCFLVGAIPYFSARTIKVRPAKSIFDLTDVNDPNLASPFQGGKPRTITTESGQVATIKWRQLVYGRDIESMTIKRKAGGVQTPAIHVVAIDTSSKQRGLGKLLDVVYPSPDTIGTNADTQTNSLANLVAASQKNSGKKPVSTPKAMTAAQRTATSVTGKTAELQELYIPVRGVKSKQKLIEIAKNLYEEIGRQEIGGTCTTKDLASLGGNNADPDLLRLRPGDAVQLLVDQRVLSSKSPLVSVLTDFARMSPQEAVQAVKKRLNTTDDNLARVLVASAQNLVQQFSTFFRVSNVKYAWDSSSLGISFDFQNYIAVRSQVGGSP